MNAAPAAAAATAKIIVNKQLTAAESAVAQAASHLELMRELAGQALVVANEASRACTTAHETLAAARCTYVAAIDNVNIATAKELQCVAELNAANKVAASKKAAGTRRANVITSLKNVITSPQPAPTPIPSTPSLCKRTNGNAPNDSEGSVRKQQQQQQQL